MDGMDDLAPGSRVVCVDDRFHWRLRQPTNPVSHAKPLRGRLYTVLRVLTLDLPMFELVEIPGIGFDARGFRPAIDAEGQMRRLAAIAAETGWDFAGEPEEPRRWAAQGGGA